MPSRNVIKIDAPDSYYHVYARGHSRGNIFIDQKDYAVFINLFKRYLSKEQQHDSYGAPYAHLHGKLELLSFALASNHFHLLIYQREVGAMQRFMRGIMTAYSRYFNRKYHRSGSLFESRYKGSLISDQSYLEHISRYIHLNRKDWRSSPYTSLDFYLRRRRAEWLRPDRIIAQFSSPEEYLDFVADYEANKQILDELKYELANDITP